MERWIPKKNEVIEHKKKSLKVQVVEVNNFWGWVKVRYPDGGTRIYSTSEGGQTWKAVDPKVQRADYYLQQENSGITDFWYDY